MTLVEFLRARIAADEERLLRLKGTDGPRYGYGTNASLLAECQAKRRIIAGFASPEQTGTPGTPWDDGYHAGLTSALDLHLRALALPYVDHPDYDTDWRP